MLDTNLNFHFSLKKEEPTFDYSQLYDVLVIGGGPAGLNAALYAKRKGNQVGIIAGLLGGQVANTSVVENYLGFDTLSGEALVEAFTHHVEQLKIPTLEYVLVESITSEQDIHTIQLNDGSKIQSKTIILATGSQSRKLKVPGEDRLAGRGVAYCAICDAPLYKGKNVLVAGGGNAAVEAAIDLSKVANHVTILHRSQFRADQILIDQLLSRTNISIHLDTQILEILGDELVRGALVLDKKTEELREVPGDGIFIEIGHIPNTSAFEGLVDLNDHNEVLVDEKSRTSVAGIFAAGDMTNTPYKQIIIATAQGATAALAANDYLNTFSQSTDQLINL